MTDDDSPDSRHRPSDSPPTTRGTTPTTRGTATTRETATFRKKATTRRTVLAGLAGALTTAGVVGAQETTTEDGETTTAGDETTTAGDETAVDGETTAAQGEPVTFQVRIVNVSEPDALRPEGGEPGPVVISPGVYAAHTASAPLFAAGEQDRGEGLEALAEDGDPSQLVEALDGMEGVTASGTFDTPIAGGEPGPIGPGDAYGFRVAVAPGQRLSFATMFVPSNDLFFAPDPEGIELFRDGDPIAGGVTDQIALWDAGTEQNEEPGAGANQAPRQSGPNTGPEENAPVRRVSEVEDDYEYPDVSESIQVLVVPEGGTVDGETTTEGGEDEVTIGEVGTTTADGEVGTDETGAEDGETTTTS